MVPPAKSTHNVAKIRQHERNSSASEPEPGFEGEDLVLCVPGSLSNACCQKSLLVPQEVGAMAHPIIPALQEAEVGGSRGQEIETILVNKVKPGSTKNTKISWAWWRVPVIPAAREAEAGELPEPRRRRLR